MDVLEKHIKLDEEKGILQIIIAKNTSYIAKCKISKNNLNIWTISDWRVNTSYRNKGIGKHILKISLKILLDKYGYPEKICYIWDGQNEYVHKWLQNNFDAIESTPIAIKKYSFADEWDSHIYNLDKKKVINFIMNTGDNT